MQCMIPNYCLFLNYYNFEKTSVRKLIYQKELLLISLLILVLKLQSLYRYFFFWLLWNLLSAFQQVHMCTRDPQGPCAHVQPAERHSANSQHSTVLQIGDNPKINALGILKCSTERSCNFVPKFQIFQKLHDLLHSN